MKFLLTHSQPRDERRTSEQIETSIIAPRGGYTDKHKSEEKNHKRISYTGLTVIAAIVVIAVAIGVYFSLYLSPSLFSFFLFSGPSSFEGNHHSCMFQYSTRMLGDNDNDTFVSDVKRIDI